MAWKGFGRQTYSLTSFWTLGRRKRGGCREDGTGSLRMSLGVWLGRGGADDFDQHVRTRYFGIDWRAQQIVLVREQLVVRVDCCALSLAGWSQKEKEKFYWDGATLAPLYGLLTIQLVVCAPYSYDGLCSLGTYRLLFLSCCVWFILVFFLTK